MYEHIYIAEESGLVTITLNRPEKLNAFVGHMRRDLAEVLEAAGSDRPIRVVVITGAGRAFSAGGDVSFMVGRHLLPAAPGNSKQSLRDVLSGRSNECRRSFTSGNCKSCGST